ncbi:MAG: ribosome maturation factor RimP [Chromatiales bacterium]|jgi:ribosome maturation factor RimP|nr:ribosome maturation factor RimP [Chromatiales bacterium]
MSKGRAQLVALLEPTVEALGYELADLEASFSGGRGVLRLYIDRPEGIRVEDCEAVSRQVSGLLDVEDPIKGDYDLEVSSPGMDRKLVKPSHFDRFAGQPVKGRFRAVIDGRRRFAGVLIGREGDRVRLQVDGIELMVPIDDIELIRLVPEF